MPKSKLGYLLFDLPSDHEVESALATECSVIEALLHNNNMKARVKRVRVASLEGMRKHPTYRYRVQFVHLACHGHNKGIDMLGGKMKWGEVAKQITRHLHPLRDGEQRVMVFSCCYSSPGFLATRQHFADYFSAAYYFNKKVVPFADAMTIWSMFYLKKRLTKPHEAIVEEINAFFGEKKIAFKRYR